MTFSGGLELLLCFVSAWYTKKTRFFNVLIVFLKSWKCISTVKTDVSCKIFDLVLLSLLLIMSACKSLKKPFRMGVQNVPKPFQNNVCFESLKQSAFMIDFGRILGASWEGFGGRRLRHEPRSLS